MAQDGLPAQSLGQTTFSDNSREQLLVKELVVPEFLLADALWKDYHETTGDPAKDRIFGVFYRGDLVSLARCRRHEGGIEVDGIWTPPQHRNKGYSRMALGALIEACHNDDLYMYAVSHLTGFYARFGFLPVPEKDLPDPIRERYTWAAGNLEGAEVQPMVRRAGIGAIFVRPTTW
ncbi:MAG: GNAT family N-acetyltransferase [Methanomicrobiales archaeon]|nr:GNAT family N-acetyltransferase [Methanomicrobiales archaeon]